MGRARCDGVEPPSSAAHSRQAISIVAGTWWAAGIAFAVGFSFRLLALYYGWEEPMPSEPRGVVVHKDHVLFGRKLSGKSDRELADLGLAVDAAPSAPAAPVATSPGT